MALLATYGSTSAFNIKVYDLAGGGYSAELDDATTTVFKRRGNASDVSLTSSGTTTAAVDRYTAYSYDSPSSTLTLSGSSDIVNGVTFTRTETYRIVSNYVIENSWTIVASGTSTVGMTNWNYYTSANAIWDIDNTNFGDGTSIKGLGIGVQLASNGPIYGALADTGYNGRNNIEKRALASQSAVAVHWANPGGGSAYTLNSTNGFTLTLTQWFSKSTNTVYDFMLQAQLAVSAAKGYTGTQWQQICKTTAYLNVYRGGDNVAIKMIPSPYYTANTYMRDSLWQSLLMTNAQEQLQLPIFEGVQTGPGQIPTTVWGSGYRQDESTCMYLIRAYYDKYVRGLTISSTAPAKALTYINSLVVNDQYQTDSTDSGLFKNLWDTFTNTAGTYGSYGQGMYCLALKCGQRMGLSITNTQIANAITQYQGLYDSTNKFMKLVSDKTFFDIAAVAPEAMSIWLFGEKMLTDTMVQGHVNFARTFANTNYGVKNICDTNGSYVSSSNFSGAYSAGDYQNGGSWFLFDYFAYYAGFYHGVFDAKRYINDRIGIELGKDPVSHEYLQTSGSLSTPGSEDPLRHVYSWNVASLAITPSARQPVT